MRRFLVALLFAGLMPAPTTAQTVERRAPLSPDAAVRIHMMVGSLRVIGWDRDSIAVTGTVAESRTATLLFHAFDAGAKLTLWDETGRTPGPSRLEVRVPAGSIVWVKTASADVTIADVTGSLDIYSVSGGVNVTGTPREVRAESLSGAVRIDGETRSAHVRTATSDITLRGSIDDAMASTVSGAVTLAVNTRRGRFESVDGNIMWDGGEVDGRTTLDFITHAGTVDLRMPANAAADFIVATFEGGFDDRLGVSARPSGSSLKGNEVQFHLGAGVRGQVTVRSFKGRVLLTRG